MRWFPETARTINTCPSIKQTCQAFTAAGFRQETLEQVPQTTTTALDKFLHGVDALRQADTTMRNLTEEEFHRGKERLRQAAQQNEETASPQPRTSWLDLLVLR